MFPGVVGTDRSYRSVSADTGPYHRDLCPIVPRLCPPAQAGARRAERPVRALATTRLGCRRRLAEARRSRSLTRYENGRSGAHTLTGSPAGTCWTSRACATTMPARPSAERSGARAPSPVHRRARRRRGGCRSGRRCRAGGGARRCRPGELVRRPTASSPVRGHISRWTSRATSRSRSHLQLDLPRDLPFGDPRG